MRRPSESEGIHKTGEDHEPGLALLTACVVGGLRQIDHSAADGKIIAVLQGLWTTINLRKVTENMEANTIGLIMALGAIIGIAAMFGWG